MTGTDLTLLRVQRIGLLAVMARHDTRIDARRRRTDDVSATIVGVERLRKSRRTETRRNDYDAMKFFMATLPARFCDDRLSSFAGEYVPGACRTV